VTFLPLRLAAAAATAPFVLVRVVQRLDEISRTLELLTATDGPIRRPGGVGDRLDRLTAEGGPLD